MGKTASNEKIKLRATFFSNAGVALYVTGTVIPLFALLQKYPQIVAFVEATINTRVISFTESELLHVGAVVAAIALSFWAARFHLKLADAEIAKMTD